MQDRQFELIEIGEFTNTYDLFDVILNESASHREPFDDYPRSLESVADASISSIDSVASLR